MGAFQQIDELMCTQENPAERLRPLLFRLVFVRRLR